VLDSQNNELTTLQVCLIEEDKIQEARIILAITFVINNLKNMTMKALANNLEIRTNSFLFDNVD
jgi:hypothetical protein